MPGAIDCPQCAGFGVLFIFGSMFSFRGVPIFGLVEFNFRTSLSTRAAALVEKRGSCPVFNPIYFKIKIYIHIVI